MFVSLLFGSWTEITALMLTCLDLLFLRVIHWFGPRKVDEFIAKAINCDVPVVAPIVASSWYICSAGRGSDRPLKKTVQSQVLGWDESGCHDRRGWTR